MSEDRIFVTNDPYNYSHIFLNGERIDNKKLCKLLTNQDAKSKELEHRIRELEYKSHINKPHWEKYEQNEGYTMETQQDIRFIERTNEALERVENSNREPMSADEFLKELDNW